MVEASELSLTTFGSTKVRSANSHSPNTQQMNSGSDISKITINSKPSDPFGNTKAKSYSFKANSVPIYVLDTLSQAHYKDQLNNSNVNTNQADINPSIKSIHTTKNVEDDYLSFSNDPFIKSMDNNWNKFLTTIKQPATYTKDQIKFDEATKFEDDLDGSWGGEDRLKSALLGSPSSDDDTFVNEKSLGIFSLFKSFRSRPSIKGKGADISPKVRSKAGYWMSDEKRADLLPSLYRIFVINPLVPLLLRIGILIFCLGALALACSIFQYSNNRYDGVKVDQQASTIMAIVVQSFAIVYLVYIAYDEYSGKPLGLREPLGKMRLIMLDLLFIIFSSANLSLTFNTLYDDEWFCATNDRDSIDFTPTVGSICRRQRSLAAFLFLVLGLWVLTFTISIIRVVDRVSVSGQRND